MAFFLFYSILCGNRTKTEHSGKEEKCNKCNQSMTNALEFVVAATQILTILCLFKGNPAWKGSLSLLFIGAAAKLFYKYKNYEEKPYLYVGIGVGIIGIALMLWFGITG